MSTIRAALANAARLVLGRLATFLVPNQLHLIQKIEPLSSLVRELQQELAAVRAIAYEARRVDLVKFGDMSLFMYVNDLAYRVVSSDRKNYPLAKHLQMIRSRNSSNRVTRRTESLFNLRTTDDYEPWTDVLHILFGHYWMHSLDFVYIDVGCQFGAHALEAANFIRSCGKRNKTICFEPGIAGSLVEDNIALNGLENLVRFEALAVSNGTFPSILYAETGHSENNRIVNRILEEEDLSYIVRTISIDEYMSNLGFPEAVNLIVKIDTQGGEYEVLQGMQEVRKEKFTTFIMEFTPWALASRVDPARFLADICKEGYVLDLYQLKSSPPAEEAMLEGGCPIGALDCEQFVSDVASRPEMWTDLLVIPEKLPGATELLERLGIGV